MNLKVNYFENNIIFNSEYINVIEIENKKYFYRFVNDIYSVYNNGYSEELTFLDENNEEYNLSGKIKVFLNYFDLEFDSKKNLVEISKYIVNNISEENMNLLQNQYNKLVKIYKRILNDIDLPLSFDEEVSIESLSKVFKVKINCKNELLDNLLLLIDIEKIFDTKRIIIFVNLKQYLSKNELIELYKYSIYNQIKILLVDSQCYGVTLNFEKKIIIDDCLNEIML